MLPSVESTHCTYGIFIHAVRGTWIIFCYISFFSSIFRKKKSFCSTFLLEFQNSIPFPVVFLCFCFINIAFHHPVSSILIHTIYFLAGTSVVNRAGQIKIKLIWECTSGQTLLGCGRVAVQSLAQSLALLDLGYPVLSGIQKTPETLSRCKNAMTVCFRRNHYSSRNASIGKFVVQW